MTTRIVFETHSTTEDNERGVATGWLPGQLSATGRDQARRLGERRRHDAIDAVFTSDLRRAVETAILAFADSSVRCGSKEERAFAGGRAGDGNRTRMTSLEERQTRPLVNRAEPSWPVGPDSRMLLNRAERARSRGWRGVADFASRSGDARDR
jgi:broad specificity phosphatase PhoE